MLYHWYELDLEAASPIDNSPHECEASHAPAVRYDKSAAIVCARGGAVRMRGKANIPSACNDTQPDAIAAHLYAAGLGMLGDPTHRAQPIDYSFTRRMIAFAYAFAYALATLVSRRVNEIMNSASYSSRQIDASCSHTIVSVGHDDETRARNGARRQRLETSRRQSTN